MTTLLILARAVHFGACLLFFGFFAFDRFAAATVIRTEIADYWKSLLNVLGAILLPTILLSGIAWFTLVAMTMSGQPFQLEILQTVWTHTQFGTVARCRLILWCASVIAAMLFLFRSQLLLQKSMTWIQPCCGGLLLGSLAWAGHGQEDSRWHLVADILHLLVAGLWPTGLLPFVLILKKLHRTSTVTDWVSIAVLVRRFSALSLAAVTLLTVTGFVNGWFLVGSFANLVGQAYGRWLLAKIIFFGIAVAIGAVNLLRLKPRLLAAGPTLPTAEAAVAQLQFNVQIELILGTAIVIVVAILGILPPASH